MPINIPDELQFVNVPSFVKPPSRTQANYMERNNLNRNNEAVRMNRAYIPETRFEPIHKTPPPAPEPQINPKQAAKPTGNNSFSLFGNGVNLDKDTLLLVALVVLLGKEKADTKLLMALLSILF
ncbi:MAG: hypothetical protein LBM87_05580 [Ruminococcus sp.]|nr:hypothetical protein [Ruminococcus sp.]